MTRAKIKTLRPTYATVNLNRFAHNIAVARETAGSDIIAIVKADGYGHGAVELAQYAFQKCGVKNFGVATVAEGFTFRAKVGEEPTIIVLGYVDRNFVPDAVSKKIVLTVFDEQYAEDLNQQMKELGLVADIALKVDTGMNRLGFGCDLDLWEFRQRFPRLNLVHVMSHLSSSDSDLEYSRVQIDRFRAFLERNDVTVSTSMYNSSGIANYENSFTYCRPGLLLYGYLYGPNKLDLQRVMSIYSRIVQVKHVKAGESISYNRTFTAEKDMIIGVVPIGYADGYLRSFSNRAYMVVDGVRCPVVGIVCMDMTMIDISNLQPSQYHADVEVLGDSVDAVQWAEWGGTISYEIVCGISDRIPRIYEEDINE